jgi:hypothetical protein
MKRWLILLLAAAAYTSAPAEDLPTEELPIAGEVEPSQSPPLEIEPPLLITTRGPDGALLDFSRSAAPPPNLDIAKLEKDLARAIRNASGADRLFKAGIISKVEMEDRGLKVIRLQASLENARLEDLKRAAQEQQEQSAGDAPAVEVSSTAEALAQAEEAAARAAEERNRAELDAALRNLQRQQKLLALGSGRKADVNRAQEKLAELQRGKNSRAYFKRRHIGAV